MGDRKNSGHSVERASCPKLVALHHVLVDRLLGAQTVVLRADNPAHSVKELFGHDVNLSRINIIKAQVPPVRNGKMGDFRVGEAERIDRTMAYIAQARKLQQPGNSNLCRYYVRERAIKKQVARIFDKNSFRQIFSSYVAQDKLPLDFLAVFAARKL